MKTLIEKLKALRLYFVRCSASYKRRQEIMKKIYEGDMKTRFGDY
jgi:hypothetical protein